MSWRVGEITIQGSKGPELVAGWVSPLFGLDFRTVWFRESPDPCGYGWCATHLPTGLAAFGLVMSLAEAMGVVDEAAALPGMDQVGAIDVRFMKPRLMPILTRLGDRIVHVNNMIPPWISFRDPIPEAPVGTA